MSKLHCNNYTNSSVNVAGMTPFKSLLIMQDVDAHVIGVLEGVLDDWQFSKLLNNACIQSCTILTHLTLVPHITSVNQVSIGSGNGLAPVWRQAIT